MNALSGTRSMLALTIRRERLHAPAWYASAALLVVVIAAGIAKTYPNERTRMELADTVHGSAAELFLVGPVFSTDVGGIAIWRSLGIAAILISLASIFTVVRNTRATEENGTSELLGASAIGRPAPLVAVLSVATAGSLLAGLIVAVGFVSIGAPVGGCILVGAQIISFGLLAAAIAGLTSQITNSARASTGIAVAVVATFYLLRGAADVIGGAAYWLSPFAWIADVRPFDDNNALLVLPSLALTVVAACAAVQMASRRDFDRGLIPDGIGPAYASNALRGPTSLALRLSQGAITGWAVGALAVGVLVGAVAGAVNQQILLKIGGNSGAGAGLTQVALYLSPLFAAILGVLTTLRLRGEVTSGRAETVLSMPISRSSWLLSHTIAGSIAASVALVAFGTGLGLAHTSTDSDAIGTLVLAAIVRAPAAWVLVALTALLLASVPRAASATAFAILGVFISLEIAVELRIIPQEALDASPFAVVPQFPNGPTHLWQTVVVLIISFGLTVLATRALRRQDIH